MSAVISDCLLYRYVLTRPAEQDHPTKGPALFIMLNPSTADAQIDDPTIRRCRGFARQWDCAGITVANLYALRSTDPKDIWRHPDPIGPDNDYHLRKLAREFETVICAWGVNAMPHRVKDVCDIFNGRLHTLMCLGETKDGHPRHPLYVPNNQPLIPWPLIAGLI